METIKLKNSNRKPTEISEIFVQSIKQATEKKSGLLALHEPVFLGNEKKYLNECIESSFVSSAGPFTDKFEKDLIKLLGVKYAVAMSSGTAALHIALLSVGVKPNDEVLTTPLTFVATSNAIRYVNAYPLFIDVEMETFGIDPNRLANFLKKQTISRNGELFNRVTNRRISCILPTHVFGIPCKIQEIVKIAKTYNLKVVEDASEALMSRVNEISAGGFGDVGVLSFNGNKIITTGGGGALITNSKVLAKKAKHLSTTAKLAHPWDFIHDEVGYNYRMPNINAALGAAQLEMAKTILIKKKNLFEKYKETFRNIKFGRLMLPPSNMEWNYWLFCFQLSNENKQYRDNILDYSNINNVMARPIWELMTNLKAFEVFDVENIPNAKLLRETIISIPSGANFK